MHNQVSKICRDQHHMRGALWSDIRTSISPTSHQFDPSLSTMSQTQKVFVVGGTGAQGLPIVAGESSHDRMIPPCLS